MNTPVSSEIDKLLLSKNIDMPVNPTIAEAVMYLYEKHGIWIGVQPTSVVGKFQFRTYYNNNGVMNQHWNDSMSKEFNSPIKAYEGAIIYTLNNLI